MRNILNLLKLQIDNKTDLFKTRSPKKMLLTLVKITILLTIFCAIVWYLSARIFILGIKINAQLIAIILLVTQIISLLFAIANILSTLYLSKDNEMLMCLPVSANQLFFSKIIFIYLKEFAINAMISLPIFISLGIISNADRIFFSTIPVLITLLPILPIALGCLICIGIMMVIKFLKKHTTLSIIILLVLVLTCLIAYVSLIGNIMETFNIASKQIETVKKINNKVLYMGARIPIFYHIGLAMFNFNSWKYILLFIFICTILFIITVLIVKPFYLSTATLSLENNVKIKHTAGKFKKLSPFASLIKKEIYSIFRSPSEIFEYFLFCLLMPFVVFTYDKLLMSLSVNKAGITMITGSHIIVVAIMAMLSNIVSASAISRDGESFYISKIMPINYFTQIYAKLVFNIIFTVGSIFVTMIVSLFIYPWWQIVLSTIAIIFVSIGHAAMSIEMDIKNPTKNFQGDGRLASVNKSTTKSILFALFIGFLIGFTIIMMAGNSNIILPYICIILFGLIFMLRKLYVLALRINMQYDNIEM